MSVKHLALLLSFALLAAGCGGSGAESSTTTTTVSTTTSTAPAATTTSTTATATTSTTTTSTTVPDGPVPPPPFQTWTVILASLDTGETDREGALGRWQTLASDLPFETGVLLSDDYPSLNAGYWVVFAGRLDTELAAMAVCAEIRAEYALECYHRWLGSASAMGDSVVVFGGVDETGWQRVDVATGVPSALVDTFYEASWAGHPSITRDGSDMYFTVGYEDYWFNCELTIGEIHRLDLMTGQDLEVARGLFPAANPALDILAYATDDDCFEDEYGFNSLNDIIVIRDLRNGINRQYLAGEGELAFTIDLAWSADGQTLFIARDTDVALEVHAFDVLRASTDDRWTDGGALDLDLAGYDWIRLTGERGGELYLTVCRAGECDLAAFTLDTGDRRIVAEGVDGAAFDAYNDNLMHWSFDGGLVVEGQPVSVPSGFIIYEADW